MSTEKKIKYKSDDKEEMAPLIKKSIFNQNILIPYTPEIRQRNYEIYQLAKKGEIKVIDLLQKYNLNINQYLTDEMKGSTVLHGAAIGNSKNNIELLNRLLSEKDIEIDIKDKFGFTPLHCAAINSNLEAIEILIQAGADYNLRGGKKNKTIFDMLNIDEKDKPILAKVKELVEYLESNRRQKNNNLLMEVTNRKTGEVTYKRDLH